MLILVMACGGFCANLEGQGYIYTFQGDPNPSELDGSYIILSNSVSGPPIMADLLDIKIVDHYGPGAVFDVSVSAQGFNITSFGPQGFTGSIAGSAQSYVPPTV